MRRLGFFLISLFFTFGLKPNVVIWAQSSSPTLGSSKSLATRALQDLGLRALGQKTTDVLHEACKDFFTPNGALNTFSQKAKDLQASCGIVAPYVGVKNIKCSSVPGGEPYQAAILEAFIQSKNEEDGAPNKKATLALECKEKKLTAASNALSCMPQAVSQLEAEINKSRDSINQTLTQVTDQVQRHKKAENDYRTRESEFNKMREELQKSLNEMPKQVNEVKTRLTALYDGIEANRSFQQKLEVAYMYECFFQKPKERCGDGEKLVSLAEFAACRIKEEATVVGKSSEREDERLVKIGSRRADKFRGLMTEIQGYAVANPFPPDQKDAEAMRNFLSQPFRIRDFSDLKKKFGSRILTFNEAGKKIQLGSVALNKLEQCYDSGVQQVKEDLTNAGSFIYRDQSQLRTSYESLQTEYEHMLSAYTEQYKDVWRIGTQGKASYVDPHVEAFKETCYLAGKDQSGGGRLPKFDAQKQGQCLEGVRRELQDLMDGSGPHAQIPLTITAQSPNEQPTLVYCQGVKKCATELKNRAEQEKTAMDRVVKDFTNSLTSSLNVFRSQVDQKQKPVEDLKNFLNKALGEFSPGLAVKFSRKEQKEMKLNDDKLPASVDEILAQMRSGLFSFDGREFERSESELAKEKPKLDKLRTELNESIEAVANLAETCREKAKEEMVSRIGSVEQMVRRLELKCSISPPNGTHSWCDGGTNLTDLATTMDLIVKKIAGGRAASDRLQSAISDLNKICSLRPNLNARTGMKGEANRQGEIDYAQENCSEIASQVIAEIDKVKSFEEERSDSESKSGKAH